MFTLNIRLGNEAMQSHQDIAGALEDIAGALWVFERDSGSIIDANGNTVGEWEITQ